MFALKKTMFFLKYALWSFVCFACYKKGFIYTHPGDIKKLFLIYRIITYNMIYSHIFLKRASQCLQYFISSAPSGETTHHRSKTSGLGGSPSLLHGGRILRIQEWSAKRRTFHPGKQGGQCCGH